MRARPRTDGRPRRRGETAEFGAVVVDELRARGLAMSTLRRLSRARPEATAPPPRCCSRRPGAGTAPLPSFLAVVEATVGAEVGLGVLPIENSLHGPVGETHDLLYEAPLSIVSEVTLPIVHCLAAKAPIALEEVRVLRSHPVAFDQCRELVNALGAKCIAAASDLRRRRRGLGVGGAGRGGALEPRGRRALRADRDRRGRRRPPGAFTRFVGIAPYTRSSARPRSRTGALLRHRPPARLALPCARAVPPPRPQPGAARLASDPALDLPLPLRHGARRPPARPRGAARRSPRCAQWTREIRIFGSYAATGAEQ